MAILQRIFGSHPGSWFGLPDFGVTERIGNAFGQQLTNQGGSNLFGPQPSQAYVGVQSGSSSPLPVTGGSSSSGGSNSTYTAPVTNAQQQNNPQPSQPSQPSYEDQMRSSISSGWDSYIGQLNDMLNTGLPAQQKSQENIANSQYEQGVNKVNTSKASSLKDIAGNMRSAFQAGNLYLGARGAGDSSAANQYSFALQKESAKQTANLNNVVNQQIQDLGSQRDQQVSSIANWFAQQQNAIKEAIANGQLNKEKDIQTLSTNLYNQGLQYINQVNQASQTKYNVLMTWAANNAQNIQQLQSNIQAIPQPVGGIHFDQSSGTYYPGSSTTTEKRDIFGNIIP